MEIVFYWLGLGIVSLLIVLIEAIYTGIKRGFSYGHAVVEVENGVHGVALLQALTKGLEQTRKGCVILNFIKLE